jgi:hypothetical protein
LFHIVDRTSPGLDRQSRLRKASILVVLGGMVGLSAPGCGSQAPTSTRNQQTSPRVVKTIERDWNIHCSGGACGTTDYPLFSFDIPAPPDAPRFDIVVTVTMDYSITGGDQSNLHVVYCPNVIPGSPCPQEFLLPGTFPLSGSPTGDSATTTSLSWLGRGLQAKFSTWNFALHAMLHDASGDGRVRMRGSRMTVAFEMSPSQVGP